MFSARFREFLLILAKIHTPPSDSIQHSTATLRELVSSYKTAPNILKIDQKVSELYLVKLPSALDVWNQN